MFLIVKNSGQTCELRLQGVLAGRDAEELKQYLHLAMLYVNDLTIDCSAVTGLDASCLQLLCSAYRMSLQQLREFTPKAMPGKCSCRPRRPRTTRTVSAAAWRAIADASGRMMRLFRFHERR